MNRNVMGAILGVLLAGSLGYNVYQYSQSTKSGSSAQDVAKVSMMRDSLQRELKKMEDSIKPLLANYQTENNRLTEEVVSLEGPNNPKVAELMQKIGYLQSLVAKSGTAIQKVASNDKPSKKDNEELAKVRTELSLRLKEIDDLKSQLSLASQQRDAFEAAAKSEQEASADMKDRIARGALPQYGTLLTAGLAKKGDQQVESFKAKSIEKLKITFDVLDNSLIREPVEEEVTIRVVGPEGDVLSTSNATLADKSKLFSVKQTIISDGEMHKVKLYYPPTGAVGKLKKGKYTTELWARGLLKQKNTFELN